MSCPAVLLRPPLRRAAFVDALAAWLEEGIVANPPGTDGPRPGIVVIVPEYLRAAPRSVLADLAARDWRGTAVAVVAYGGRTRGRFAVDDAREVLDDAGARLVAPALGVDVSAVRVDGFDEADVLLRDLVLDRLAEEVRTGRTPGRARPRGW